MNVLIVAGGDAPSAELLRRKCSGAGSVIAADRGIEYLTAAGIEPDFLVGDLDSAAAASVAAAVRTDVRRAPREKNETDLELAARLAVRQGAAEVTILGATGGRVDHLLGNLNVLLWLAGQGVPAEIEDDDQSILAVVDKLCLHCAPGETISILPAAGDAVVTAHGLYYPLEKLTLSAGSARGVSNVAAAEEVCIETDAPVYVIRARVV